MSGLTPRLYECRVISVNAESRNIDALARDGSRFKSISYLLPWISAMGSGMEVVPRVGDMCLVLSTPPSGVIGGRLSVCIGFKVQEQDAAPPMSGLEPGSIGFRVLTDDGDEATLIVTRSGTVIAGANVACRTVYSPIDDSMISAFGNAEAKGPGGYWSWRRSGSEIKYHRHMSTKTKDGGLVVDILLADNALSLTAVNKSLSEKPLLSVVVGADGVVKMEAESLEIVGRSSLSLDGGQVKIKGRQVLGQGDPI